MFMGPKVKIELIMNCGNDHRWCSYSVHSHCLFMLYCYDSLWVNPLVAKPSATGIIRFVPKNLVTQA